QSTANFGAPSVAFPTSIVILDAGNPAFDKNNPFATPFEYQSITSNSVGTNTLTINNGVRAAYAGTTPKAFFPNATVAVVLLAEDITSSLLGATGPAGSFLLKARAYLAGAQSITPNVTTLINLDTKDYDPNNNFNTSTHQYTTPIAGYY